MYFVCVTIFVLQTKEKSKADSKSKFTSWDGTDISPLKSISKPDRFSLLTPSTLRSSAEDNIHLISTDD